MAAKGSTKKPRAKAAGGGKKRAAPKAARPALGNDPFLRGAAERPIPSVAAVPPEPDRVAASSATSDGELPDDIAGMEGAELRGPTSPPAPTSRVEEPVRSPSVRPERRAARPEPTGDDATPDDVAGMEGAELRGPTSPPAPAADSPTELDARIASIERKLEREMGRVADVAVGAAERLADLAREEASGAHARDLLAAVASALPALKERLAGLASLGRLFDGPGELDFFGMDRELVARAAPVLDFLYGSWWRVAVRRIEVVPAAGPVILVANHGGALPWDALVLRIALHREHPARRELRPLLDEHALRMPVVGGLATRLGAAAATPENALHLLGEARVIAVFPEGSRVARRPWSERYKVQRFGRGGFAKLALRSGAPIVPCAIVGSEETAAPFARAGWLSERLGLPAALAPTLPLGLLSFLPLPSRWSVHFGEPIDTAALGAAAADDPAQVLELTERTRSALQDMLDRDVAARRSVYL
ncbi:MAG: 1-acyl-sn-glycerol-3-phosphate acyltransferase [Anaeromyxobacteraceae bacterium]